jgi:hypothetical protein
MEAGSINGGGRRSEGLLPCWQLGGHRVCAWQQQQEQIGRQRERQRESLLLGLPSCVACCVCPNPRVSRLPSPESQTIGRKGIHHQLANKYIDRTSIWKALEGQGPAAAAAACCCVGASSSLRRSISRRRAESGGALPAAAESLCLFQHLVRIDRSLFVSFFSNIPISPCLVEHLGITLLHGRSTG